MRLSACLVVALALLTVDASGEQPSQAHQIGYLIADSPAESTSRVRALRAGLQDHGYVEEKNITLVFRSAETADRLPDLAADLVRLNVDLIFAPSSTEVEPSDGQPRRSQSCSPRMPTRKVSATWPALPGPAATSRGSRCSSPSLWPRNSR